MNALGQYFYFKQLPYGAMFRRLINGKPDEAVFAKTGNDFGNGAHDAALLVPGGACASIARGRSGYVEGNEICELVTDIVLEQSLITGDIAESDVVFNTVRAEAKEAVRRWRATNSRGDFAAAAERITLLGLIGRGDRTSIEWLMKLGDEVDEEIKSACASTNIHDTAQQALIESLFNQALGEMNDWKNSQHGSAENLKAEENLHELSRRLATANPSQTAEQWFMKINAEWTRRQVK